MFPISDKKALYYGSQNVIHVSIYILYRIGSDMRRFRCRDSVGTTQLDVLLNIFTECCFICDLVLKQVVKGFQSEMSVRVFSLSSAVKEKLTADPDSEIATTSLRVSLLCPVNMLPAPHEFKAVIRDSVMPRRVRPFFSFLFSLYVSQHAYVSLTSGCVHDPPVKLSS